MKAWRPRPVGRFGNPFLISGLMALLWLALTDLAQGGFFDCPVATPLGQHCDNKFPESTPTSAFTLYEDGTAVHHKTGLMWMRCALGQTWDGSTCP